MLSTKPKQPTTKMPAALADFDARSALELAADIACKLFDQRGDAEGVVDG